MLPIYSSKSNLKRLTVKALPYNSAAVRVLSSAGPSSFADLLGSMKSKIGESKRNVTGEQPPNNGNNKKWMPKNVNGETKQTASSAADPQKQRRVWTPASTKGAQPDSQGSQQRQPSSGLMRNRGGATNQGTKSASSPTASRFAFNMDEALSGRSSSSSSNSGDSRSSSTPISSASPAKTGSLSIRDSLRQAQNRAPGSGTVAQSHAESQQAEVGELEVGDMDVDVGALKDARAVREDILSALGGNANANGNTNMPGGVLKGAEGVKTNDSPDVEEVTEGELRYRRYRERIRIDKEKFQSKLPPPEQGPKYRKSAGYGANEANIHADKSMPEPAMINNTSSSSSTSSSSNASSGILDIGEMKRRTAAKLREHQEQQQHQQQQQNKYGKKGSSLSSFSSSSSSSAGYREQYLEEESKRAQKQREKEASNSGARVAKSTVVKTVSIPAAGMTLRELSSSLSLKVADLKLKLEELGESIDADSDDVQGARGSRNKKAAKGAASTEIADVHLDADVCELVVLELGLDATREEAIVDLANQISPSAASASAQTLTNSDDGEQGSKLQAAAEHIVVKPRSPVVCVMGHVDHGKTTLLDALRRANVAASEAGGITQKLSAFCVEVGVPTASAPDEETAFSGQETNKDKDKVRSVVFLDTPGHAAFSAMRCCGATATDLVVLVVAMDDGVRPQTKEALKMAQDAGCSVMVALNKVDKIPKAERSAARARVLSQLVDLGLVAEDYGGEAQVGEVSGRTGEGVSDLVEKLLLQADVLELKASYNGQAEATVLDARMEKGRGVVADVLVQWGRLAVGDPVVIGSTYGRVKAMTDDRGRSVESAGPSTPVRLLGLRTVPTAGEELLSVASETKARQIAERRERLQELKREKDRARDSAVNRNKEVTVVSTFNRYQLKGGDENADADAASEGDATAANAFKPVLVSVLIKADGVGTLEALQKLVKGLASRVKDVELQLADCAVGDVTRTDVERAATVDQAIILGFNVGVADSATRAAAKELDVRIVRDTVIYRLEDELRAVIESHMPKERTLVREGLAKVQQVFSLSGKKAEKVAGLIVQSGTLRVGSGSGNGPTYVYRVIRNRMPLTGADGEELKPKMLKRFKDTVNEVAQGLECGLALEKFDDFEEGDEIECLLVDWRARPLTVEDEAEGTGKTKPIIM